MVTQARGLIQDQNPSAHFDGVNVSKSQKNGGLGERKALNDISNAGRPSAFNSSKTHISKNVISIGEDIGSSKPISSFGRRVRQSSNDGHSKKLDAVVEEFDISGELVPHNHQECIKQQLAQYSDTDYYQDYYTMQLTSPWEPLKLEADSPPSYLEIEEMSEFLGLDRCERNNTGLPSGQASPFESPKSPEPCATTSGQASPFESPKSPEPCSKWSMMWEAYHPLILTLKKSPNH